MSAGDLVLRLAAVVVAALGGWLAASFWLAALRVRDATLRSACWTLAVLAPVAVAIGLPGGGLLGVILIVPPDWFLFRHPAAVVAIVAAWALGAAALLARGAARHRKIKTCLAGLADAAPVPDDLADDVRRAARWTGVAAPPIAAAETDGTAFVAGVRGPILFVPLTLWRRLDAAGRRAMLLHEMAHVRRRDALRLRVLTCVVDLLWPALPLRWAAKRLCDAWEAQADEEAVHGGATRLALARSLVLAWSGPRHAGVLAFGGTGPATARRLAVLGRRPRVVVLALQAAALLALFPWCPVSEGSGVDLYVVTPEEAERTGRVTVVLGAGGNPIVGAVVEEEMKRLENESRGSDLPRAP